MNVTTLYFEASGVGGQKKTVECNQIQVCHITHKRHAIDLVKKSLFIFFLSFFLISIAASLIPLIHISPEKERSKERGPFPCSRIQSQGIPSKSNPPSQTRGVKTSEVVDLK